MSPKSRKIPSSPRETLDRFCAPADDPRPSPSVAVVVAHPDDEVLGMGARLARLRDVTIIHVTDGSPQDLGDARANGCATREEYASLRRREFDAAMQLVGVPPERALEMGCPDQETSLRLVPLSEALCRLFQEIRPEAVVTHPYEGGHPDHDATAFAVHAAVRLMTTGAPPLGKGGLGEVDTPTPPVLLEMTSYFNHNGSITPYEFLPGTGGEEVVTTLSPEECDLKRRLIACYPSQWGTLQYFPVGIERFRVAPRYDFTCPPHPGALFYECFSWGMTGERFRALAAEALHTLGFGDSL